MCPQWVCASKTTLFAVRWIIFEIICSVENAEIYLTILGANTIYEIIALPIIKIIEKQAAATVMVVAALFLAVHMLQIIKNHIKV